MQFSKVALILFALSMLVVGTVLGGFAQQKLAGQLPQKREWQELAERSPAMI